MKDLALFCHVPEHSLQEVLSALAPYASSEIRAYAAIPLTKSVGTEEKDINEELAQKIAAKVAPTKKQPMRRQVLQSVLWHWDSFRDTEGEGDNSMRAALGSLSKALREFAPLYDSPIELICIREREFQPNGGYLGTVYRPTALGVRVREILIEQGKIK